MKTPVPALPVPFSSDRYREFLTACVNTAPAMRSAAVTNTATGEFLSHGGNGSTLSEAQNLALIEKYFSVEGAPSHQVAAEAALGQPSEVMLWFEDWAVLACHDPAKDVIAAVVLPPGMEVVGAVSRLSRIILGDGDHLDGHGAGQALLLAGDTLNRAGELPSVTKPFFVDEDAATKFLKALFGDGDLASLIADAGQVRDVQFMVGNTRYAMRRIPFAPENILTAVALDHMSPQAMAKIVSDTGYDILRHLIDELLAGEALAVPDTNLLKNDAAFSQVIRELRGLEADDLVSLLQVGGFANHSMDDDEDPEMIYRCQECIYYLTNRRWCDLPELPVPVEPEWYCRLWKV